MSVTDSPVADRHLSAFHRGQARLFRARIGDLSASAGPAMKALVAATDKEFTKRRGNCPRGFLPDLERRELPARGLLALDIARTRRTCTIVDTRLIPERVANPGHWGEGETEMSLIALRNIYELTRTCTRTMSLTTASLSLHSIARYLQRSAAPRQFEKASDGTWLGEVAAYYDVHGSHGIALHVRTFIASD